MDLKGFYDESSFYQICSFSHPFYLLNLVFFEAVFTSAPNRQVALERRLLTWLVVFLVSLETVRVFQRQDRIYFGSWLGSQMICLVQASLFVYSPAPEFSSVDSP